MKTYLPETIRSASRGHLSLLVVVTATGIALRVMPSLVAEYPLNLGGFYYAIIEEIEKCGLLCYPETISYYGSGDGVPFVYPPIGFYVTAVAHSVLPSFSLLEVLKGMSIVLNIGVVILFAGLAYSLLQQREALAATLAFATVPAAFTKLIGASAPVRTLGFIFLLLGSYYYAREMDEPRNFWPEAVLGGFTALSGLCHPITGVGAVIASTALVTHHRFIGEKNARRILPAIGVWGSVTFIILSPYLANILMRGEIHFLLNGGTSRSISSIIKSSIIKYNVTKEPFLKFWGVLSIIGIVYILHTKRQYIAWWGIAVVIVIPAGDTNEVTPIILAAGVASVKILEMVEREAKKLRKVYFWPKLFLVPIIAVYTTLGAVTFLLPKGNPVTNNFNSKYEKINHLNENIMGEFKKVGSIVGGKKVMFVSRDLKNMEWGPAIARVESFAMPYGAEWIGKYKDWLRFKMRVRGESCIVSVIDMSKKLRGKFPGYIHVRGVKNLKSKEGCSDSSSSRVRKMYENSEAVLWRVIEK